MNHSFKRACFFATFFILCIVQASSAAPVEHKPYGTTKDGKPVEQYVLTNRKGASVAIITYGATVTNVNVLDNQNKLGDVVLGYDTLAEYEKGTAYFGAIVGRVANRIARGKYTVGAREYHAAVNNGPNSLHGGLIGYSRRVWNAEAIERQDGPAVSFTLTDPDGTEGYPGAVRVTVVYTLTNDDALRIEYVATTEMPTPINLTNHTYWNIKDGGKTSAADSILKIFADQYTPTDDTLIPTGQIVPVKGTPLDFTSAKSIGKDMESLPGKIPGYDHNLVLQNQNGKLAKALELYESDTGRVMEMWTTEPGVQFYSGNFADGTIKGKGGIFYAKHGGVAFEAQHYPDSINQPNFPSTILRPGQTYTQTTEYRFSTVARVEPF